MLSFILQMCILEASLTNLLFLFLVLSVLVEVYGDCINLPVVEHSTSNATQPGPYPEGYTTRFTCDSNYRTEGNVNYMCDGEEFQGSLTCIAINCPWVDAPRHGKIANDPNYEVGSTIKFECDPGYEMSGQASRLCRVDAQWSLQTPECLIKGCGDFGQIPNARIFQESLDGVLNDYGSKVKVDCNSGYVLNGMKYVYCQADGTWQDKPVCKEVKCPPYPGSNSSCVYDSLLITNQYYIACRDDVSVTKTGGDASTCNPDGSWSDLNLACYCDCFVGDEFSSVSYKVSDLNAEGYLTHNSELNWGCGSFLNEKDGSAIICIDGKIDNKPACKLAIMKLILYIIIPVCVLGCASGLIVRKLYKKWSDRVDQAEQLPMDDNTTMPIYKNGGREPESRRMI